MRPCTDAGGLAAQTRTQPDPTHTGGRCCLLASIESGAHPSRRHRRRPLSRPSTCTSARQETGADPVRPSVAGPVAQAEQSRAGQDWKGQGPAEQEKHAQRFPVPLILGPNRRPRGVDSLYNTGIGGPSKRRHETRPCGSQLSARPRRESTRNLHTCSIRLTPSGMPATRTPRRDVVLRVPKLSAPGAAGSANHGGRGVEEGLSSLLTAPPAVPRDETVRDAAGFRRSMSPVKGLGRAVTGSGTSTFLRAAAAVDAGESGNGIDRSRESAGRAPSHRHAAETTSAAEWNSLLIWARRQRGPQWDSATGMCVLGPRGRAALLQMAGSAIADCFSI